MYQNPTLFPQITTRETWLQVVKLTDEDTGEAIALTDGAAGAGNPVVTIKVELQRAEPRPAALNFGSGVYYDGPYDAEPILSASIGSGVTIIDTGVFQIRFTKTQMQTLTPGTYDVFMTIADVTDADDSRQIMLGRLPVLYGGRNT